MITAFTNQCPVNRVRRSVRHGRFAPGTAAGHQLLGQGRSRPTSLSFPSGACGVVC
jgi:hypothetical protein